MLTYSSVTFFSRVYRRSRYFASRGREHAAFADRAKRKRGPGESACQQTQLATTPSRAPPHVRTAPAPAPAPAPGHPHPVPGLWLAGGPSRRAPPFPAPTRQAGTSAKRGRVSDSFRGSVPPHPACSLGEPLRSFRRALLSTCARRRRHGEGVGKT